MPQLKELLRIWDRTDLLERFLEEGELGAPDTTRPFVVAGLAERVAPLLVVVPRSRDAEAFASALRPWMEPSRVALLPAWEVLPGEAMSPTLETMGLRIRVIRDLDRGEGADAVVCSVRAFVQKVVPPREEVLEIRSGAMIPLDQVTEILVDFGYERNYLVERPGEFSIRGGILDVFAPGQPPMRADYLGDEITSLREFSVSSQRSGQEIQSVQLLPTRELRLTGEMRDRAAELIGTTENTDRRGDLEKLAAGIAFPGMEAFLPTLAPDLRPVSSFLPSSGRLVFFDPKQTRDRASDFLAQAAEWGNEETRQLFSDFDSAVSEAPLLEIWSFGRGEETPTVDVSGWDEYVGRPANLAASLRKHFAEGSTVSVAAGRLANRARDTLAEADFGLSVEPAALLRATISEAEVERGFLLHLDSQPVLALVGQADLFGRRRTMAAEKEAPARPAALLLQLAPGDYVVHELYGVGRYHGMVTREVVGVARDYLLIEYAGEDRLYVPTDQLDAVTKYSGGESPRLNRLGTGEWEKAKSRAGRAVKDIAEELVVLYAKRMQSMGFRFSADTPWQRELEDSFPHIETPDQERSIDDVKSDMEREIPMDRLICGDVGYGKTEIAVRGVFKAVQDSKQAAVLVPTTILAQQHTQTFKERFAGFPVEVANLSRFLTDGEQRDVVDRLGAGKIDVVIGTHRLLQPDVKFHDLGLLIVDEEQRFGVRHKELIKKMRENVDVITMSATPIPRTLEMSLTGIRDMSLVDTPPLDRRPVLTYVGSADDRMVVASIRRELARDGQVFYVHNRVRSIKRAARKLAAMVPGARVEIAHGQMSEGELERVMIDVWDGKVDVLVCTTIIESGLDIPAMNTLIIERADLLGLAQLYQLRGRVGRAGERAYAYLFYPDEAVLTDEAHERLKTVSEFTELGSGFKIALRDLEIRGAGNLLGAEQSGHIAAVGFDLYVRMMGDAVASLSGTKPKQEPSVRIDLPIDAFVPASYIARESLRMEAYRQIEKIRSSEDATALREELADRYGPIPAELENLLLVAELRSFLAERGIAEAIARDGILKIRPFPSLSDSQRIRLDRLFPTATYKEVSSTLLIPTPPRGLARWGVETLHAILD